MGKKTINSKGKKINEKGEGREMMKKRGSETKGDKWDGEVLFWGKKE